MSRRRVLFIANPSARRLADRDTLHRAIRDATAGAGLDLDTVWTQAAGDGVRLARAAAADGIDDVFACGGDGTLNEVLNGLAGFAAADAPRVGQVPAGTANVWAREAGIPRRDLAAAIRAQLDVPSHAAPNHAAPNQDGIVPIDLGCVGERRFLLMASFGFDAAAVAAVNPALKKRAGPPAYVLSGLKTGWRYPGFDIDLSLDDDPPLRLHASLLVAGNTRSYGGHAEFTAQASAIDGQLDIVAFRGHGVWPALRILPGLLRRRHLDSPHVLFRRARRIRLQPVPGGLLPDLQLDGEIGLAPSDAPLDLHVQPGAVRMLVPRPDAPLFRPPSA